MALDLTEQALDFWIALALVNQVLDVEHILALLLAVGVELHLGDLVLELVEVTLLDKILEVEQFFGLFEERSVAHLAETETGVVRRGEQGLEAEEA